MKGTGTKEQLKFLSLKIEEATSKSVAITEKKIGKPYIIQIISINHGLCLQKLPLLLTLQVNQSFNGSLENIFVCRWLQINDKKWQIIDRKYFK